MATPKAVTKSLKASATKIEKLLDPVVREAAEFAIVEATRVGGEMKGYALFAAVASVSNKGNVSTAVVEGVPSGFWAIKSYGRRAGYTIRGRGGRPLNLRGNPVEIPGRAKPITASRAVTIRTATSGDQRWDRVVEAVAAESPNIWLKRVGMAVA